MSNRSRVKRKYGTTNLTSGDTDSHSASEARANIIAAFMDRMEEQVNQREFKATIADFVRLLQVQREIEDGRVREVTVKWVGQSEGVDVYKP
jgi:hypothetical protein